MNNNSNQDVIQTYKKYSNLNELETLFNNMVKYIEKHNDIKENFIEGFTDQRKCCPDGFDLINGKCEKVCINCKFNNCNKESQNLGQVFQDKNKKALEVNKENEEILDYIFSSIDN